MEIGLVRADIINKLNLSLHGDLKAYRPVIGEACRQDPEFLAHLIAYDFINGQIRDSKIALPVITIGSQDFPDELVENSLAHLAMKAPRELLRALRFSLEQGTVAPSATRFGKDDPPVFGIQGIRARKVESPSCAPSPEP